MTLNRDCPICQGRGWFERALYDLDDIAPCPSCNPVEPLGRTGFLLVVGLLALLLGITVWGFR